MTPAYLYSKKKLFRHIPNVDFSPMKSHEVFQKKLEKFGFNSQTNFKRDQALENIHTIVASGEIYRNPGHPLYKGEGRKPPGQIGTGMGVL